VLRKAVVAKPQINGTGPGTRTPNQLIKSQLLYRLS
jgi:hypothetical protein